MKQKYYTKCGREFEKSSTASVTGHVFPQDDEQCQNCPFQVDITEGYPPVHKRWECRAGSEPPNQKNDWSGSLNDKCTLGIWSLHNDFMEAIRDYCKTQPDISASYNQDMADCRRVLSISCSQNKKGIAAKQALIEKFFPEKEEESSFKCNQTDCPFSNGIEWCCHPSEDPQSDTYNNDIIEAVEGHSCNSEDVLLSYKMITDPDSCDDAADAQDEDEEEDIGAMDLEDQFKQLLEDGDSEDAEKGEEDALISEPQRCSRKNEACAYYCAHNGGCSLLIVAKRVVPVIIKQCGEVDCDMWRMINASSNKQVAENFGNIEKGSSGNEQVATNCRNTEKDSFGNELVQAAEATLPPFDYSTMDEDTASFLRDKASKITQMRITFMLEVAKELIEVHDRLANHYKGTFGVWCESINISRRTAERYISAYEWVATNCRNIDDAKDIQPSLLFAASRPSAPSELQEAVLSGDITTHKQYKEKEAEWKAKLDEANKSTESAQREKERTEAALKDAREAQRMEYDMRMKIMSREHDALNNLQKVRQEAADKKRAIDSLTTEKEQLAQSLEQAKRNGSTEKVQELGGIIAEKQKEIEALKQQLKEKPIEVPAVQKIEVVPDSIQGGIVDSVSSVLWRLEGLKDEEIDIYAARQPHGIESSMEQVTKCIQRLQALLDTLNQIHAENNEDEELEGCCGMCEHADMDNVTEEELGNNKTFCILDDKIKNFEHACVRFKQAGS